MIDYALILQTNYAGAEWSISGNDYDNQVTAVETTRRLQYEAQSDGLFFEWQRGTNTKEAWEAAVQAVKNANPYPPSIG